MKRVNQNLNSTRRKFIRNLALTAVGLTLSSRIGASRKNKAYIGKPLSCAPTKEMAIYGTLTTAQSGNWSNPATWGGKVPEAADIPVIANGHIVTFDLETATISGMNINVGGTLKFDPTKSTTLQSSRNILLEGNLIMRPDTVSVVQTMRFININEDNFIGAGMEMLEPDIGLWVMTDGQMDLLGHQKTSWTRAKGAITAGATTVELEHAPVGWNVGDELTIAPTEPPTVGDAFLLGFDDHSIMGVSGATVTLNSGTLRAHPKVNNQWTAEVLNLTRNVRIEGTEVGNSHIFIRSTKPQYIKYIALRFMGPRKDKNADGVKDKVSGRYGFHFHHSLDGSRGSILEGNVVRDTANNAYVPHFSHGVSFTNNVAYNVTEPAFWWDEGDLTHDTLWEGNIVALNKFVFHSLTIADTPTFLNTAFEMGKGDNNIARNNVAVGVQSVDSGSFDWEANNDSVWEFTNNLSHNSDLGIRVWQNSTYIHLLKGFRAYHNKTGIFHGAYANTFKYEDTFLYANLTGIKIKAASNTTARMRIENSLVDGAGISDYGIYIESSPLDGGVPLFLRNLTLKGHKVAGIYDESITNKKSVDVIGCEISAPEYYIASTALASETIRVQPLTGQPFKLVKADQPGGTLITQWNAKKTDIPAFAPTFWGTGDGLKGEYYNSTDFTKLAFSRIDFCVVNGEWSVGVNYAITSNDYSVRWTGQIQPQFNEDYTFYLQAGGGYRLWIDDKIVMDDWLEKYPDFFTAPKTVSLLAGRRYNIKIEYFNSGDNKTGLSLLWSSPSLPQEYVPQSQLYSDRVTDVPAPPTQPPADNKVMGQLVSDVIKIQSAKSTNYLLFDELGRLLMKGSLAQGLNFIQISHLKKGPLFLKLNNTRKAFKLVKMG
jgi:PA14 domain/G8 domain